MSYYGRISRQQRRLVKIAPPAPEAKTTTESDLKHAVQKAMAEPVKKSDFKADQKSEPAR